MGKQYTVAVLVLAHQLVVVEGVCHLLTEANDVVVPRHVFHRQLVALRFAAIRDALFGNDRV